MLNQTTFTLVNPQNGNLAFKIFSFEDNGCFDHIQRQHYFSLLWIRHGSGVLKADFSSYGLGPGSLLAFAPYQPYMIGAGEAGGAGPIGGIAIYFHPEFFCIHKHHEEIAYNGVLYNNVYQSPIVKVDEPSAAVFQMLCDQIRSEMAGASLAQYDMLVSYLKIFLITATRLKVRQQPVPAGKADHLQEPVILQKLKDAIETHYKTLHSPGEYAELLYISPKALAKLTRTHFNKTLSDLINERIVIEAKRELYLTNKPVKEIAYELGYEDEYYFSRFFKVNTDVSPQLYRETVGFGKGGV